MSSNDNGPGAALYGPGAALYGPGTSFPDRAAWLRAARNETDRYNSRSVRKGWRSRIDLTPGERCASYLVQRRSESRSEYWDAEFAWHQSQQ
jgi:hypothetical protein